MKEKFKAKQSKVLAKNISITSSHKSNEEMDECLVCHRGKKENEPLVVLSAINKEKTASSSIHKH